LIAKLSSASGPCAGLVEFSLAQAQARATQGRPGEFFLPSARESLPHTLLNQNKTTKSTAMLPNYFSVKMEENK
jgi:hypothetical protein